MMIHIQNYKTEITDLVGFRSSDSVIIEAASTVLFVPADAIVSYGLL